MTAVLSRCKQYWVWCFKWEGCSPLVFILIFYGPLLREPVGYACKNLHHHLNAYASVKNWFLGILDDVIDGREAGLQGVMMLLYYRGYYSFLKDGINYL